MNNKKRERGKSCELQKERKEGEKEQLLTKIVSNSIYESIQKEKVRPGDVIYIEANSGAVKRVGRSDAYATEADLEVSLFFYLFIIINF